MTPELYRRLPNSVRGFSVLHLVQCFIDWLAGSVMTRKLAGMMIIRE